MFLNLTSCLLYFLPAVMKLFGAVALNKGQNIILLCDN